MSNLVKHKIHVDSSNECIIAWNKKRYSKQHKKNYFEIENE